jgi:hypothetical protein
LLTLSLDFFESLLLIKSILWAKYALFLGLIFLFLLLLCSLYLPLIQDIETIVHFQFYPDPLFVLTNWFLEHFIHFVLFTLITSPAFCASSLNFIKVSASACCVLGIIRMSSAYAHTCLSLVEILHLIFNDFRAWFVITLNSSADSGYPCLSPVFTLRLSHSSLFILTLCAVFLSVKAVRRINFLGILYPFKQLLISDLSTLSNACLKSTKTLCKSMLYS